MSGTHCFPKLGYMKNRMIVHRGHNTLVPASHFCNVPGIVDSKVGSSSILSHLLETEHCAYVHQEWLSFGTVLALNETSVHQGLHLF